MGTPLSNSMFVRLPEKKTRSTFEVVGRQNYIRVFHKTCLKLEMFDINFLLISDIRNLDQILDQITC